MKVRKQLACSGKRLVAFALACLMLTTGLFVLAPKKVEATGKSYVIMLDPGHDAKHKRGIEKNSLIVEETYNLQIARALKKELESYGFTIYIDRGTNCPAKAGSDVYQCLEQRAAIAKQNKADLLISLHVNASGANDGVWRTASGSTVIIPMLRKYMGNMSNLAEEVSKSLQKNLGLRARTPHGTTKAVDTGEIYPDGSLRDAYKIIREATLRNIPSILIEHGFMDNRKDSSMLKKKGPEGVAKADCEGIVNWYKATYGALPKQSGTSLAKGTEAYVDYRFLRLRSKASTSASVVVTLDNRDKLVITEDLGDWCKVTATHKGRNYVGYVYESYIKKGKPEEPTKAPDTTKPTESSASESTKEEETKAPDNVGYVNFSFLNLRKQASTRAELIVELSQNDKLTILKDLDGWYKVKAEHKGKTYEGYVYKKYVKKGTPKGEKETTKKDDKNPSKKPDKETTKKDDKTDGKGKIGIVNYEFLNVREKNDTKSKLLYKLNKGDQVTILSTGSAWMQISYKDDKGVTRKGYVAKRYITVK